MTEVESILDQLRRAFEGQAWHGPSVMELLADVTAAEAAARPLARAHSIWELALHIAAWENAARRRLTGDRAELPTAEDWPALLETGEAAWQEALQFLKTNHQELRAEIARLTDAELRKPILEGMSSIYGTLHGVIQHDLYHAGQIALLKKALR
ncbi:MAG TPA: DinB family protein [Pyrinomonadaceae bacterium]